MTKGRTILMALLALTLSVPAMTQAQGGGGRFSTGGDTGQRNSSPWSDFKLDPNKKVKLMFRNASVDSVIEFYASQSGIMILKDPKLTQKITIISPNEVKMSDAFEILNAQLGLMGFQMEKQGNLLVIKAQRSDGGGFPAGFDPSSLIPKPATTELRVYRIKYANASAVSQVINEVFLQRDQANNPLQQFFGGGGGGAFGRGGRNQGRNGFGGGFNPAQFSQGQQGPTVRASSDDYSNTVIVNAPKEQQFEV